ncbi:hypothetical protein C8Q74DRAFT_1307722 [Fomes fomentarius]|nr:hypothetical protein C8Q74DRAFT_1307722 [Fomes fomentarius]
MMERTGELGRNAARRTSRTYHGALRPSKPQSRAIPTESSQSARSTRQTGSRTTRTGMYLSSRSATRSSQRAWRPHPLSSLRMGYLTVLCSRSSCNTTRITIGVFLCVALPDSLPEYRNSASTSGTPALAAMALSTSSESNMFGISKHLPSLDTSQLGLAGWCVVVDDVPSDSVIS